MKKELNAVLFPDFRRLSRADAIACLTYLIIIAVLFSTPLHTAIIAGIALLLPVGYIAVTLLTTRKRTPAEELK